MVKNITNEHLAEMIQRGFQETSTKKEMEEKFRQIDRRFEQVDERFEQVDEKIKLIVESMDFVRADIHDMKLTLGPLVRTVTAMEDELRNFHLRISRLERKTGITK